jgi:hypothetical protein
MLPETKEWQIQDGNNAGSNSNVPFPRNLHAAVIYKGHSPPLSFAH